MRALPVLALLLASPALQAVRTLPVETYATLVQAGVAQHEGRNCTAPAGSTVLLVARLTDVGQPQGVARFFVRVVDGPCAGHALTVDAAGLRDQRATPAPAAPGS